MGPPPLAFPVSFQAFVNKPPQFDRRFLLPFTSIGSNSDEMVYENGLSPPGVKTA